MWVEHSQILHIWIWIRKQKKNITTNGAEEEKNPNKLTNSTKTIKIKWKRKHKCWQCNKIIYTVVLTIKYAKKENKIHQPNNISKWNEVIDIQTYIQITTYVQCFSMRTLMLIVKKLNKEYWIQQCEIDSYCLYWFQNTLYMLWTIFEFWHVKCSIVANERWKMNETVTNNLNDLALCWIVIRKVECQNNHIRWCVLGKK